MESKASALEIFGVQSFSFGNPECNNMKTLKRLLILVCCIPNLLWANAQIDNLETQLQTVSGDKKIELLTALTKYYAVKLPQKGIDYGMQALKLTSPTNNDFARVNILTNIGIAYKNLGKYDKALDYFLESLPIWQETTDKKEVASTLLDICIVYWRLGNYDKALEHCLSALKNNEKLGSQKGIADSLNNIGIVYELLGHYNIALEYHFKAKTIREDIEDKEGIADTLNCEGIIYYFKKDYERARSFYLESLKIRQELDDKKGIAKSYNNLAFIYQILGNNNKALDSYFNSLKTWQETDDKYEIANVSNNIGKVYTVIQSYEQAFSYLEQGLKIAGEIEAKALVQESYEFFSDLYAAQSDYQKALEYYKLSAEVKSRIFTAESSQKIADMQTKIETDKQEQEIVLLKKDNEIKQLEVDRQKLLRNSMFGGFLFVVILALVMYNLYLLKKKANTRLALEKAKSDKLLLNILPARVANDLKETGETQPELFEHVTVYFSDIVGFTNSSSRMEANFLLKELNDIFTAFDNIIEKNQCERIKTIGDAYLCVCGMPEENPHHAENIVNSAIEIIKYLQQRNQVSKTKWEIRIGIHTGRVVGGVVGIKKYIYDVFGDTINTVSRMESNSEPMKINISEMTYQIVKDKFKFIERGSFSVKGKGKMKMYFCEW